MWLPTILDSKSWKLGPAQKYMYEIYEIFNLW